MKLDIMIYRKRCDKKYMHIIVYKNCKDILFNRYLKY